MTEPSEAEEAGSTVEIAVYVYSSALFDIPEAESDGLDAFLRGKVRLMINLRFTC